MTEQLTMAGSYIIFEDEQIRLRIPKQLRVKRGGTSYFFSGVLKRGRKDARVILGIDIDLPPVLRKAQRKVILKAPVHQIWLGVETRDIRKGRCTFGDGGIEALSASIVPEPTGNITLYQWNVLYRLGTHYVDVVLFGGGNRDAFEKMGTTIIESIEVKSLKLISSEQSKKRSISSIGSMVKKVKHGGLKAKEKTRLANALKSLPEELHYLIEPILDIASKDQELLGSGVVDTPLLAEAIENQANLQPNGFATQHSKKLKKWLKSNISKDDKWAGPVWFVMASLMGYDAYKDWEAESTVQSLTKVVNRLLDME
jgi:hypothetical protein